MMVMFASRRVGELTPALPPMRSKRFAERALPGVDDGTGARRRHQPRDLRRGHPASGSDRRQSRTKGAPTGRRRSFKVRSRSSPTLARAVVSPQQR